MNNNNNNPGNTEIASTVVESGAELRNSKRTKAIDELTCEIGIESKKIIETLGERSEIKTPLAPVKKKTRVVKKIVKKTVIKKVPKRMVVVSPNCNDNGIVVDELKEVVNVKEFEVSDKGKGVASVENDDSCRIESERSAVFTTSLSSDQNWIELQDVDQNGIELQDSDQKFELQNRDQNLIELPDSNRNLVELPDVDKNWVEMLDSDQNRVELRNMDHDISTMDVETHEGEEGVKEVSVNNETNVFELQNKDQNRIELQDSDQNQVELPNVDQNWVEMLDSDQNRVELQNMEHDISTMDVEAHEGEEGVKEVATNNETNVLKLQDDLSEGSVVGGEMAVAGLRVKHRTKIFIHGLDKEIKEKDIRRVFEEIGKVVEVKLITNFNTGKSRGFGFIRYASADLANMALTKFHNVEICGRPCITAAIEGTDAILLNNIDKKWNSEDVATLLHKIGIKKIDEVWVVPDSENTELNLGYAFLELETKKDAQIAYNKLQNKNVFGKDINIKVSWAEPLADPVKEEMHNGVKSVFAEHIPSSWDENEVKDHFIVFGAIDCIAHAKNLRSTNRNDFAFINFKSCEAARLCVEAFACKKSTNKNDPEGKMKVSLAKSIQKAKPVNINSQSSVTEVYKKVNQSIPFQSRHQKASRLRPYQECSSSALGVYRPQKRTNMNLSSFGRHEDSKKREGSSTTDELVRLLREQASWKHGGSSSTAGVSIGGHRHPSGGNQAFTEPGSKSLYIDRQTYPQTHFQIPNPAPPRPLAPSFPHYDQQRAHYTSGPFNVAKPDPRHSQIRDQATYPGSSSIYRHRH